MALLFFDGFDHYSAWDGYAGRKWDVGSVGSPYAGRYEGQAVRADSITKTIVPTATVIIGAALRISDYQGGQPFLVLSSNVGQQVTVGVDAITGHFVFKSSTGTVLGTTGSAPPVGLWFYFELKYTPGGDLECRVNEDSLITLHGVPQNGSNYVTKITWQSKGANSPIVDDFYVCDTAPELVPGVNVDFLGDVRVQTKYPDAFGYRNDWTPASGPLTSANRAAQVNAPVVDLNDTPLYNASGSIGSLDSYSIGNFTVAGNIFGVQANITFRKGDVGNRSVTQLLHVGANNFLGTDDGGADFPCYSSYTIATRLWSVNPNNHEQWSLVDLNAAEFGAKVVG